MIQLKIYQIIEGRTIMIQLTKIELELLSLVLADYLDNVDPSLDSKLLAIFQKIKHINKENENV